MNQSYYWCFTCERAFEVLSEQLHPLCPFCTENNSDVLDWQSYIFGLGYAGNYPDIPEHGGYYPIDPVI